jgi:hypothetical protein
MSITKIWQNIRMARKIQGPLETLKDQTRNSEEKPLDQLIKATNNSTAKLMCLAIQKIQPHAGNTLEYGECGYITSEQMVILLDGMRKHTKNPEDLLSEETLENAINYGRTEIIPQLVDMGAKVEAKHFGTKTRTPSGTTSLGRPISLCQRCKCQSSI